MKRKELGIFSPRQLHCNQFNDDNSDFDSGGGTSDLVESLFNQAATLTNTAIIANANPVNAAILTNTPISTPQYVTAPVQSKQNWLTLGLLLLAGVGVFYAVERRG